jgi:hypothetical protein
MKIHRSHLTQPDSRLAHEVDFAPGGVIELIRQMGRGIHDVVLTAMSARKFMRILDLCVGAGFCLVLIGCAGPMNDRIGKTMYTKWTAEYAASAAPYENIDDPDAFIFKMKAIKDYEYGNYVTNLRRGTSWGEFGSDSVKIILDSLVAVTGSEGTKAALGAASAGLTGATSSIKKNVLFDQSITTFITKMDTLRLTKWNEILCKMGRGPGTCGQTVHYTGAEAFGDLQEYGRCGTLDAALRAIDSKTSEEKVKAEAINNAINKIPKLGDKF